MYKCNDCLNEFETPNVDYETSEFWGNTLTERVDCCPHCQSDSLDYSDTKCDCCDAFLYGNDYYINENDEMLCIECYLKRADKYD